MMDGVLDDSIVGGGTILTSIVEIATTLVVRIGVLIVACIGQQVHTGRVVITISSIAVEGGLDDTMIGGTILPSIVEVATMLVTSFDVAGTAVCPLWRLIGLIPEGVVCLHILALSTARWGKLLGVRPMSIFERIKETQIRLLDGLIKCPGLRSIAAAIHSNFFKVIANQPRRRLLVRLIVE